MWLVFIEFISSVAPSSVYSSLGLSSKVWIFISEIPLKRVACDETFPVTNYEFEGLGAQQGMGNGK